MTRFRHLALGISAAISTSSPAGSKDRDHQLLVEAVRAGKMLPLREIEEPILRTMKGYRYLGPEANLSSLTYRLKFFKNGGVIWIDVDGRTGRIIGRWGE